ncbi:hypothetical protein ACF1AX_08515 [Streptomyces sp. NPDC014802]|uniref:hypothetical protein n=1 Tax=Streptomyces sp. NPDC014802 TaxID=3364917 RepID=UPI0036F865A4
MRGGHDRVRGRQPGRPLPALFGAPLGGAAARVLGPNGPALFAAALFALAVAALIPARHPDVPVVASADDSTTARAAR